MADAHLNCSAIKEFRKKMPPVKRVCLPAGAWPRFFSIFLNFTWFSNCRFETIFACSSLASVHVSLRPEPCAGSTVRSLTTAIIIASLLRRHRFTLGQYLGRNSKASKSTCFNDVKTGRCREIVRSVASVAVLFPTMTSFDGQWVGPKQWRRFSGQQ